MDFTDFTFRVLLLFLPGIITTVLINRNTGTKDETSIQFFMRALMYGFISYYILMFIYFLLNIGIVIVDGFHSTSILHLKFFEVMNDPNAKMDFIEIFFVSLVSVIVACVKSSYENNVKMMDTVAGKTQNLSTFAKIVKKYHEFLVKKNVFEDSVSPDVWHFLLTNIDSLITVRDWKNKLAYVGTLKRCSPTHVKAELYLEDVTIVDMTGRSPIRDVDAVYLCKDKAESWDIEFNYNYTNSTSKNLPSIIETESNANVNNVNVAN